VNKHSVCSQGSSGTFCKLEIACKSEQVRLLPADHEHYNVQ
jgi:hypothetical protein